MQKTKLLVNLNIMGILCTLMLSYFDAAFLIGVILIASSSLILSFKKKLFLQSDIYFLFIFLSFFIGTIVFCFYWFTNSYFNFPDYEFGQDMMKSVVRDKFAMALVLFNAFILTTRLSNPIKLYYLHRFFILCLWVLFAIFIVNVNQLDYYWETTERLSGFSRKTNQLSAFLTVLPFLGYRSLLDKRISKRFYMLSLFLMIVIGILTESEGLFVAVAFTFFIRLCLSIFNILHDKNKHFAYLILLYIVTFSVILAPLVIYFLFGYFDNDRDQATTRVAIWMNSITAITYSPLFGFGPGAYSGVDSVPFVGKEAHNTILDFLGYGGLMFLLIIIKLYYRIIKRIGINDVLVSALISLTIFGMFHNNGRTPYYWVLLFFLFHFTFKKNKRTLEVNQY